MRTLLMTPCGVVTLSPKPVPKPHIKKAEGFPELWEARGQRKIQNGSYLYACAHGYSPAEAYAAYIEMWRKHDAQAAKA